MNSVIKRLEVLYRISQAAHPSSALPLPGVIGGRRIGLHDGQPLVQDAHCNPQMIALQISPSNSVLNRKVSFSNEQEALTVVNPDSSSYVKPPETALERQLTPQHQIVTQQDHRHSSSNENLRPIGSTHQASSKDVDNLSVQTAASVSNNPSLVEQLHDTNIKTSGRNLFGMKHSNLTVDNKKNFFHSFGGIGLGNTITDTLHLNPVNINSDSHDVICNCTSCCLWLKQKLFCEKGFPNNSKISKIERTSNKQSTCTDDSILNSSSTSNPVERGRIGFWELYKTVQLSRHTKLCIKLDGQRKLLLKHRDIRHDGAILFNNLCSVCDNYHNNCQYSTHNCFHPEPSPSSLHPTYSFTPLPAPRSSLCPSHAISPAVSRRGGAYAPFPPPGIGLMSHAHIREDAILSEKDFEFLLRRYPHLLGDCRKMFAPSSSSSLTAATTTQGAVNIKATSTGLLRSPSCGGTSPVSPALSSPQSVTGGAASWGGFSVNRRRFLMSLHTLLGDKHAVEKVIANQEGVADVVAQMVRLLFFLLWLIGLLIIVGVDPRDFLISSATVVASVAFVFGNSAKNFVDSLVFVFAQAPFSIGDRVKLSTFRNEQTLIVRKLTALTTTFETVTGEVVSIPNFILASSSIVNHQRSAPACIILYVKVHPKYLSLAIIKDLRDSLKNWLDSNPAEWSSPSIPYVNMEEMTPGSYALLCISAQHNDPWFVWTRIYPARTELLCFISEWMSCRGILYELPSQPFKMIKNTEDEDDTDNDYSAANSNIQMELSRKKKNGMSKRDFLNLNRSFLSSFSSEKQLSSIQSTGNNSHHDGDDDGNKNNRNDEPLQNAPIENNANLNHHPRRVALHVDLEQPDHIIPVQQYLNKHLVDSSIGISLNKRDSSNIPSFKSIKFCTSPTRIPSPLYFSPTRTHVSEGDTVPSNVSVADVDSKSRTSTPCRFNPSMRPPVITTTLVHDTTIPKKKE